MQIFIPTAGRAKSQPTLAQLLKAGLKPTLVVQTKDSKEYRAQDYDQRVEIITLPDHIKTIAPTRQYILENLVEDDHFCMVDDDLHFYTRREDDRTKLRDITPLELHVAFDDMDKILSHFGHVGFAAREGANRNTDPFIYNTRIMRVLGYNRQAIRQCGARFDRMEVMEDFHMALSLLEDGTKNIVLNNYAHNQAGGSGAQGGCSTFRTPELQSKNANLLAALHPGFVTVVRRHTKGAWGGGSRTDVTVHWKRAYAEGTKK